MLKLFRFTGKRNKRYFFILTLSILASLGLFVTKFVSLPYYFISYPNYVFISGDYRPEHNNTNCNPFNLNSKNLQFKIDDDFYPKRIPLFQNQTLNFTCLNSNKREKTILLWNQFKGLPLVEIDPLNLKNILRNSKCPVTNCEISMDRSKLNHSDLILFHMRKRIDEFPKIRFEKQRWVYVVYESQQNCPMCSKLDGLFNLSATYRSDSDITSVYLADSKLKWTEFNPNYNLNDYDLGSKTGFGVILISDCADNLKRIEYIKELRKYIPVDIYGKCSDSNLQCPFGQDCRRYLANKYKFFFAFENSICNEYITEKFFNTLNYNTLPVVLGAGDYAKYVPKSAYINAIEYNNLEDLANYLIYLSSNQTAYSEFFKWKRFITTEEETPTQTYLCELCIKLQLEEFTGFERKTFGHHSKVMGMRENCKGIKVTNIGGGKKKFEYVSSPQYFKMRYL